MTLKELFTQHPREVNETYLQHMHSAGSFAVKLFYAGAVVAIHALLPFLFTKTASGMVTHLYDVMVTNRKRTS